MREMKVSIRFEERDKAKENMIEFLEFLESTSSHKIKITLEMNYKERLALEYYAHQMNTNIEDVIESSIRSRFDRLLNSL